MTKAIQVNVVSRWLYALSMLTGIFGAVLLGFLISTQILERLNYRPNQLIFIGLVCSLWYLINRITKNLSKGKVNLQLDNEGVEITWIKQFFLHKRETHAFKWEEIKDYMYQPEQHFDLFRIRLHNKRKIKLSLDDNNEEFYFFYVEFEEFMNHLNLSNENIKVAKAKTIYETAFGLIMAIILSLMIIGVLLMFIFVKRENSNVGTYLYLFATIMGALFYIMQVYRMRKSAKKNTRSETHL